MCYLYLISIPCFLQKSRGAWQQHMQTQSRAKGIKLIVYQSIAIHLCGNQPVCRVPPHRAGVASMAWRATRRFSTKAP
jgi:hypothetical protein